MIKLVHITGFGLIFIVFAFPIYGILIDIGMYVYQLGILQYPTSILPVMMFIYNFVYPNLPLMQIGALFLFAVSYGLFKRYY